MPNNNVLQGFKCPDCGNEDEFRIAVSAWAKVTDNGTEDFDDVEWDDNSVCSCPDCGLIAKVKDFQEQNPEIRP